jgi:aldose sugar dehydrogenase
MPATNASPLVHIRATTWLSAAGVLLGLAAPAAVLAQSGAHSSQAHDFRVTTVVEGLENPWSMAWLPNGDMLVTERPGRLRIVRDGKLLPEAVPGVPAVRVGGQGGLQEVAVHPDFSDNRYIYLSMSKDNDDGSLGTTSVVRGRFDNDRLTDVEEVFEAQAWGQAPGHYGARIVFDGNGYMFISVGDRMAPPAGDLESHPAQDLTNHQGTIVRLHDDGRVPDDNPFVGRQGVLPEIWSYGHRNPQGLAMNPETGALWDTEHGPQGGDELNVIEPGNNYGWPVIGYGVNYGSGLPIHKGAEREGMEVPAAFWVPSIATSGLMFYTGDKFPMWRGNLFAGGMSAQYQQLSRLSLDGTRVTNREALLSGEYRIRDVRQGPDGLIYIAVDHRFGQPTPIVRLEPAD